MTRWCDHRITFTLDRDIGDSRVFITFRQNGRVICEYSSSDAAVLIDGDTVTLSMSPDDTQLFSPSFATVQLNLLTDGMRQATEVMRLPVYDNLCSRSLKGVGA